MRAPGNYLPLAVEPLDACDACIGVSCLVAMFTPCPLGFFIIL
jgi:hypothetical protein